MQFFIYCFILLLIGIQSILAEECICQEVEVHECPVMNPILWGPIMSGAAFCTFLGSALTNYAHVIIWEREKRLAIQADLGNSL